MLTQCHNTIALYIIRVVWLSQHECPLYHSCLLRLQHFWPIYHSCCISLPKPFVLDIIRVDWLSLNDCPIYHSCWWFVPRRLPYISFVLKECPNTIALYMIPVDCVSQHDCLYFIRVYWVSQHQCHIHYSCWQSVPTRLPYISFVLTLCPYTIALYIIRVDSNFPKLLPYPVDSVFQKDFHIYHSCWLCVAPRMPYITFVLAHSPNTIAYI